jgi:hypothetical protein
MAAIGVSPASARQRIVLVTAALLAAVTLVAIAQLNELLHDMRSDGSVAGSLDDLTVSILPPRVPSEADVEAVVGAWRGFDSRVVSASPDLGYAGPVSVANAILRWDSFLLVPVYVVFLLGLRSWARRWPEAPPGQPAPRALHAVARSRLLIVVVAVAAIADLVEDYSVSALLDRAWESKPLEGHNIVVISGVVKWAALVLALTPFAIVGLRLLVAVLRPLLRTAWVPLVALVLLGVAATSNQAAEVVRRWGVGQTIWAVVGVAVLAVAIGCAASRSFQIGRTPVTVRAHGRPLTFVALGRAAVALLPLAVATAALALACGAFGWKGLMVLAAMTAAAFFLSLPIRHYWDGEQQVEVPTVQSAPAPLRQKIGAVMAAVVPFLVGVAIVRAMTADVFFTSVTPSWFDRDLALLVLGFVIAVVGSLVTATAVGALITWLSAGGRVRRWGLLGGLGVVVALPSALLTLRSTTMGVAQGLGGAGIVLVFLSGLVVVAAVVYVVGDGALRSRWARDAALPPAIRLLGFQRPPLVGIAVIWLLLSSLLRPGGYYDVRLLRRAEADVEGINLRAVVADWRERANVPLGSGGVPLVVVASSGGGLRGAYWTSVVLDCVLERQTNPVTGDPCGNPVDAETVERRRSRVMAMSGTSGGGLGVVAYDTHADVDGATADPEWYDARLRDDFFAPTLAWGLFRDSLATLLRPSGGRDRASALERAWERPWEVDGEALSEPFLTTQGALDGPLLLLSGTTLEDGCRLNTSIIPSSGGRAIDQCGSLDPSFEPFFAESTNLNATTDLLDFLCPEDTDVRRSTAALLAARLPYFTPAGRLIACSEDSGAPRAHAVDGSYRDASAASPIVELWPEVETVIDLLNTQEPDADCVVPYFIQIDGDQDLLPATEVASPPSQLSAPFDALRTAPGGYADASRVAAQRLFTGPVDSSGTQASLDGQPQESRWARLAPLARPAAAAVDSWVLSDNERANLRQQVSYHADTITTLRSVLDADPAALKCEPADPSLVP